VTECKQEDNLKKCNCTYEPCSRKGVCCDCITYHWRMGEKGVCCDCITYHWRMGELPACLFPPEVERTYDRSVERFILTYKR
jgi:hypothetical protein